VFGLNFFVRLKSLAVAENLSFVLLWTAISGLLGTDSTSPHVIAGLDPVIQVGPQCACVSDGLPGQARQ
jgi:hypothetical protein